MKKLTGSVRMFRNNSTGGGSGGAADRSSSVDGPTSPRTAAGPSPPSPSLVSSTTATSSSPAPPPVGNRPPITASGPPPFRPIGGVRAFPPSPSSPSPSPSSPAPSPSLSSSSSPASSTAPNATSPRSGDSAMRNVGGGGAQPTPSAGGTGGPGSLGKPPTTQLPPAPAPRVIPTRPSNLGSSQSAASGIALSGARAGAVRPLAAGRPPMTAPPATPAPASSASPVTSSPAVVGSAPQPASQTGPSVVPVSSGAGSADEEDAIRKEDSSTTQGGADVENVTETKAMEQQTESSEQRVEGVSSPVDRTRRHGVRFATLTSTPPFASAEEVSLASSRSALPTNIVSPRSQSPKHATVAFASAPTSTSITDRPISTPGSPLGSSQTSVSNAPAPITVAQLLARGGSTIRPPVGPSGQASIPSAGASPIVPAPASAPASVASPSTSRRGGMGSSAIVRRGKFKFILPEFGVDLKELLSRYNVVRGIPFVLVDCINYIIDKGGLDNARLFIAPVREEEVKDLRATLELGGSAYEAEKEVYTALQMVKDFLKELPDPLCSSELLEHWLDAANQPTEEERRHAVKRLVFVQLPEANRNVLQYVISFLYLYALTPSHVAKNKANVSVIADLFGPLVIRAPKPVPATTTTSSTESASTPGPSPADASAVAAQGNAPDQAPAAPTPSVEVPQETARMLFQMLLENMPTMLPLLPSVCPALPPAPVFGVPLEQVMLAQASKHPSIKIPYFIHQALARLRKDKDLHKEGLFRLSGNAEIGNRARTLLNHDQEVDMKLLSRDEVASLVKTFARELPQPLFISIPKDKWIATLDLKGNDERMAEELRNLLAQLPQVCFNLWREILVFLYEVSLKAEVNKMTPANLGIVWGPNVFCDEQTLPVLAMNEVVANMIRLHPSIYPDPLPATEQSLESAGSGGREAANREQLLLSLISPTDAELEEMRKMPATRSKLYKKDAQEQRKALKEKQKEKEDKSDQTTQQRNDNIRIVMVGPQCGKSCLVTRFRMNEFIDVEDPTIQDDHVHKLTVNGTEHTLHIRDISGDTALYSNFYPKWLSWGDGFIMVYNIADAGTFDMLNSYRERILKAKDARSLPMCIVGTQMDQEDRREVLTSDGKKLAFEWKAAFTEASSETGENVEKAFTLVVQEILSFGKEKEETRLTRVERERLYQEKLKAEQEAAAAKSAQEEKEAEASGPSAGEQSSKVVRLSADAPGFSVERGQARVLNTKYHSEELQYGIENADHNIAWYKDYFMGKEHKNFCGMDPALGPIIISVVKEKTNWRVIYRSERAVERLLIPIKDLPSAGRKELIPYVDKRIVVDAIKQISSNKLHKELLKFEEGCHVYKYKFGVLFCRQGQTKENDMFTNNMSSIKFDKFLSYIGDKIPLKGWKRYDGGLDVSRGSTGDHSVFAELPSDLPDRPYEIMYHVSTMLPFSKKDVQQLERKRHLGNDVVVIIFQAGETTFDPTCIASEFNHVWFVVREETNPEFLPAERGKETYYRIEVVSKDGVAPIAPYFPDPPVFAAGPDFRQMFLHKLINAENAAYHAPAFISKMRATRKAIFSHLIKEFKK